MKILRRHKLMALAALMLAAILFTPPAWCADSTTLTGIAGTIGPSKSAGGSFEALKNMPENLWVSVPWDLAVTLRANPVYLSKHGAVAYVGTTPVISYTAGTCSYDVALGGGNKETRYHEIFLWVDASGHYRGSYSINSLAP